MLPGVLSGSKVMVVRTERYDMALKRGELYRCPGPDCGCEIEVTKGAAVGNGGNLKSTLLLRRRDGEDQLTRACCC